MRVSKWFAMMLPLVALTFSVLLLGAPVTSAEETHAFVGSKNCKKCHLKEFKSWEATKMAKAFESLKPGVAAEAKHAAGLDPQKDYTADAECVGCHTTGHGQPGGFVSVAETPDLVGVGCEECHGAGGTYLQDGYMTLQNKEYKKAELVAVGMVAEVTAAQCTKCHSADNPFSPGEFDFAASKDKGTHEIFPLKYPH